MSALHPRRHTPRTALTGKTRVPMVVLLAGLMGAAMMIPAAYASTVNQDNIAQCFFYSGIAVLLISTMLGIASTHVPGSTRARRVLSTMLGVMVFIPLVCALPFAIALPDTGIFNAWWEMVSCFTTTGASLYEAGLLDPTLHLWRALVGWVGGLLILTTAIAILAPLRVGGFELMSSPFNRRHGLRPDEGASVVLPHLARPGEELTNDGQARMARSLVAVTPVYAALTLALWIGLLMAGDAPLHALCRAMGTFATSGISPVSGAVGQSTGVTGEFLILFAMIPALSRRFWPGGGELKASETLRTDPELRIGLAIIASVTIILFVRHFLGATDAGDGPSAPNAALLAPAYAAAHAAWGGLFTALSFLTTTGWLSVDWVGARAWSGLGAPGLMLAGLAIMGGGVATTAGGVKLLRVYALSRHGQRELERMIHPHSIAGGGRTARRLRHEGAYLSFIFFMLFALTIAISVLLVSIYEIDIESATLLSVAALTNTGPLAQTIPLTPSFGGSAGIAGAPWAGWAGLPAFTKAVLAATMVVGRIETLALLALVTPEFWRR